MPTLGKFIQRRRIELGYTQEQLAEKIGPTCRQAEVSRLENDGVALPRRQRLEQIAIALDVSIGELLARSGWAGAEDMFDLDGPVAEATPTPPITLNGDDDRPDTPTQPISLSDGDDRPSTLSDAITRAEELIAISDQMLERSQVAYGQARRAVKHSSSGRGDKARLPSG
jgi:transcriptional regulator with XRE-family HTH domain